MGKMLICKLLQRRTYDFLSQKYTILALFIGTVIIIVSLLHFGETMIDWSHEKYAAVFYPFSDNLAGKNFQKMLCQHVPIDVVYSWVNGTDPKHLNGLSLAKRDYGFFPVHTNSCMLSTCVQSHMVLVIPELPRTITVSDLEELHSVFGNVQGTFAVSSSSSQQNTSVLVFKDIETANIAAERKNLSFDGQNYTIHPAFLTDNWLSYGTVTLKNIYLVLSLPKNSSEQFVHETFPSEAKKSIEKVIFHPKHKYAIVQVSKGVNIDNLISTNGSMSLPGGKSLTIVAANLVIEHPAEHEDISASRFADNEELRYSLRSLEKHAPWVQHVYIVTNGQIPYWLNLDSPRVTIVTHEELFPNKSHLPTFSSPAIECHLHRIPNLSEKFLYLNDDVMFGKDVWPEDFYSHTKGQKVYLSWPVPNCAEGCPSAWIRDGYCDKPCNNSFCLWDGGDCTSDNPMLSFQGVVIHQDGATSVLQVLGKGDNCNGDCVNTWLADRYCDKACNVRECAFDAGDCSTSHYDQLLQLELKEDIEEYRFPDGEMIGFFNMSNFIGGNYTITEGFYDNHAVVRTISMSLKFSVLTVLLNSHFNTTRLAITLKGEAVEGPFEKLFYLTVNTEAKSHMSTVSATLAQNITEEVLVFENFPKELRYPKLVNFNDTGSENCSIVDIAASDLPSEIVSQIENLNQRARNGEITEKGYWKSKCRIVEEYKKSYYAKHSTWPKMIYNHSTEFRSLFFNLSKSPLPVLKSDSEKILPVSVSSHSNTSGIRAITMDTDHKTHPSHIHVSRTLKAKDNSYYDTPSFKRRTLLDTFGDSLRHVNNLYNEAFGYESRKVPSHIAHFVDKNVMSRLYERFSDAFDETSSHKIRRSNDMQFAFSYYYYLMSEMETVSMEEIFDSFDVDSSGTWSDREIRTLLTRLHDLPLDTLDQNRFQQYIINCSSNLSPESVISTPIYERYYETGLPTVSKSLVLSCHPITSLLEQQFGQRKRSHFEVVGEEDVAFKMIHNNLSHVLGQIDDLRKNPKKFVCLNDNMKHGTQEAELIRSVIQDFYESLFPVRSQFELPPDYRNRFLYMDDLKNWRKTRDMVRYVIYISIGLLILFTLMSFCKSEVRSRPSRSYMGRRANKAYQV